MSVILKDLEALLSPANSALLADVEGAFAALEALIGSVASRNMALAFTSLEQVAMYVVKGLIASEQAAVAPSAPVEPAAS
jgi:hypothetical protein